jgi:hypothetical protein
MEIDLKFNKYLKNKYLGKTKWSTQKVKAAVNARNSNNKGTPVRRAIKKLEQLKNSPNKQYESNYLRKFEGTDINESSKNESREKPKVKKEFQKTLTLSKPEDRLTLEGVNSDSSGESSTYSDKYENNDAEYVLNLEPSLDNPPPKMAEIKIMKRNLKQEAIDSILKEIDKDIVSSFDTSIVSDEVDEYQSN